MYTLNTNAIIYYMENDATVAPLVQAILDDPTIPVYVSTITEAELFSHATLSAEEIKVIDDILQAVSLVPPVSKIARAAGRIRGTYGLKLADSFIATTALYTGSTLLTRNVRDFKKSRIFLCKRSNRYHVAKAALADVNQQGESEKRCTLTSPATPR